jgi:hypothetical protein
VPFTATVTVDAGTAVVEDFSVSSQSIYVNESVVFTIAGYDGNGEIVTIELDATGSGSATNSYTGLEIDSIDTTFTITYDAAGTFTPKVRLTDEDGISTAWISGPQVTVDQGVPQVTGIGVDSVWVFDDTTMVIDYTDNGTITGCSVSVDGLTFLYYDTLNIDTAFETSGWNHWYVKVVDEDDNVSAVYHDSVWVKLGAPVVDSVSLDTVWVVDDTMYTVYAQDPNGSVDSFRVSFDNGTSWAGADSAEFMHAWDTAQAGLQEIIVEVMDDDSVWGSDTFEVFVRLGRPVVSLENFGDSIQIVEGVGGALDTMFYVYKGGKTSIMVDAEDSNGVVGEFYLDFQNDGNSVEVQNNLLFQPTIIPHTSYDYSYWVKDDDGLISDKIVFIVYADAPPPTTTTTSDASPGVRIIRWSGKDVKDGDQTQYKIVAKIGSASATDSITINDEDNPDFLVHDFQSGSMYTIDGIYDYNFTYTPNQGSGIYHYRIIARDARGSETRTSGDPQFGF